MIDLHAYLQRIGYTGTLTRSHDVLEALHLAHATHIPFENLDILLGRPIRLDLGSLQAKLVLGRRGGYCFEQNLLFAGCLQALGFSVTQLAARVRYRTRRVLPRTHMLLLVDVDGSRWIADVGFGLAGLLTPLRFAAGEAARQSAWTYRILQEADHWILQWLEDGSWMDLYEFSLAPQQLADYEMANHYTSTHPDSRFVQTLTVQRIAPEVRYMLRNRELTTADGTSLTSRRVADDDELLDVLAGTFDLRFPAGTRFRYHDAGS